MKKRIALLLSFVLVLSLALCACGESKAPTVVGTWKTEIDLVDMLNQEMEAAGMGDFVKLESFNLPLIMEFKEDGTGSITLDQAAMDATIDKLAQDLTAGVEAYFTEYFASMGLEIDLDEALAAAGISMDDLVNEMKAEFAGEDAFAEFTNEFNYKAEDGKLYMSDDLESEINMDIYNTYKFEGDTLTLEAGNEVLEEGMEILFPMVLKRAN